MTNLLPLLSLLLTIILDTYKFFWGDKIKTKVTPKTFIFVGGFFIYFVLFLSAGSWMTINFIDQEVKKDLGGWVAFITLPLGYILTKKLYYRSYPIRSKTKSPVSYQVSLHYFIFTSGSVALFVYLTFILLFIAKRY